MERPSTSTSSFGVSRRENHDASSFYGRFTSPEITSDEQVQSTIDIDRVILGDARDLSAVNDNSVALVVTSPPYFAGKQYEEALGEGGVPATYLDYLEMLRSVFSECVRVLEPGGRIAVNVANLGRRPFRSLAADVTQMLQDDLRLLLRGEIVWIKQRGASGSCAWGSFQRATNPVLRDTSERVIIASKGRFDRALSAKERVKRKLPYESTITREEFMESTLDVWEIPPESATRIGHPAPFPVELPARLIELYTFRDDLVLDPFLGAGSTAVAAVRLGRHYLGYDLDPSYLDLATARIKGEREAIAQHSMRPPTSPSVEQLFTEGRSAIDIARELLHLAGFREITERVNVGTGLQVSFRASDHRGKTIYFEVVGVYSHQHHSLDRPDVLWRTIGEAAVLHLAHITPLVILSAGLPDKKSSHGRSLRACTGIDRPIAQTVDLLDPTAETVLSLLYRG